MVLIAIVSIQTSTYFAKQLFPLLGAVGTVAVRQAYAAVILALIFKPWRLDFKSLKPKNLVIYGVLLGVMNLTFYLAIERIPLGIAVALEFIGPLCLALFSSRRPIDYVWIACVFAGLYWLLPIDQFAHFSDNIQSHDILGIVFALVAGVCWALYIIYGRRVSLALNSGMAVSLGMIVSTLITLPLGLAHSGFALFSPPIIMTGLGLAILSCVIPYGFEMAALKHIPTKTFSLMMSLEPAVAALFGFILLHEALSLTQTIAIGLVALAAAGSSLTTKSPAPIEAANP